MIIVTSSYRKDPFTKCFPFTPKRKDGVFRSSGLMSFLVSDGLVWTFTLTTENKSAFLILQMVNSIACTIELWMHAGGC